MYQSDDLAAFEIPTVSETRADPVEPGRVCPESPDRECMLRHLYAVKHNHWVRCATCGPIVSKVHKFREKQKKTAVQVEQLKRPTSQQQEKRKHVAIDWTPEMVEARKERALAALAKAREAVALRKKLASESIESEKIETIPPKEECSTSRLDRRRKGEFVKSRQKRLDIARRKSEVSMRLAKNGQKSPSRVQSVVILLEEMIKNGQYTIKIVDALKRLNSTRGNHKIRKSSILGIVLRDYGLTVRSEFNKEAGHKIPILYIDETAKEFIDGGYFYHEHGNGSFKR